MALSQIQCLDDGSINCRITESKPEFLYSEDHRLALEILFHDGREAYEKYLTAQNVRGFLSDHELDHLTQTVVLYNPGGHGETVANGEGEDGKVASEYWPERSDHSYSELDLGWPDISSYRGVTRVTVHTQPPMDGQPHIKEVVRRTISQAQKVIAVVMDMFTDVDIFRDLLDMSYRRRVAIYIVLEATGVSHFLHMCDRAGMHKGHLKRLRVSCMRGTEFLTHSSKKVCGAINHNFMFVDGDKTVSGSYSFTWSSSRLDRNVITLLTGQAVETFDRLFRDLYFSSRAVSLANVTLVEEPEVEPVTYTAQQAAAAAALARKAYSAKYALLSNSSMKSGGTCSSKNTSGHLNPLPIFLRQVRLLAEEPRIHPGLVGLEKANMMHYLPTWPEPDPPSDVIGIINVRDTSKPFQAHLMRSELFETSQAIRFKEPFHVPAEPLPEKATPRPRTELGQPLKTKGEEENGNGHHAGLVERVPHRQQLHARDSVLTPAPLGGPGMAHLGVVNGCGSQATWVKGSKEAQVNSEPCPSRQSSPLTAVHAQSAEKNTNVCDGTQSSMFPQAAKDFGSAPDCAVEPEHPCSAVSAKPEDRTVSNAERNLTLKDPWVRRTNAQRDKGSHNGAQPQPQPPKDPSSSPPSSTPTKTSLEHSHCNGSVPDKSKSNTYVNGHHTPSSGTVNGKQVKTEGKHATQKSPVASQKKMDKKHSLQRIKTEESAVLPTANGESYHANGSHSIRDEKAGVDGKKAGVSQVNQQTSQEKTTNERSQETPKPIPIPLSVYYDFLKQNSVKEPTDILTVTLASSEPQKEINNTAVTVSQSTSSNDKVHTSLTKSGEKMLQSKDWIAEETLFISEEGDEMAETTLTKSALAAAPDMKDKRSETSPKSKREPKAKVEAKHSGLSNPKKEPSTPSTPRSNSRLAHGVSTSNLAASKLKGETGGQLRDKGEKSHHRSTQDIAKQLRAESKSVTRPASANKREGSQTPTLRDKAINGHDKDLPVRNAAEQTRPRTESDAKKVSRAPTPTTSRSALASRPEGGSKVPGSVKPDPVKHDLAHVPVIDASAKTTTTVLSQVSRAPTPTTSKSALASRAEGGSKVPGSVKPDPIKHDLAHIPVIDASAKTTTTAPAKAPPKYKVLQGKVFSSTKTKQVKTGQPLEQVASGSISQSSSMVSLNKSPVLAQQMAGSTNSPLGQSLPSLDKSKTASPSPSPKSSISFPKLSQLRSLKQRITRSPSQKSLTTTAKKGAA